MRKIYHANPNQKKAGRVTLISDRADFKAKKAIKDKERHSVIIKGSVSKQT